MYEYGLGAYTKTSIYMGLKLTHVRVKAGYIDQHTYIIVIIADTWTFKGSMFTPKHIYK